MQENRWKMYMAEENENLKHIFEFSGVKGIYSISIKW